MYKSLYSSFMVLSLVFLPACWQATKKDGLFVVNVLDTEHYDDCHIRGSINVALDQLDEFASSLDKQNAEIVFYCSNYRCTASSYAAKKLTDMGFKHVWAYEAGMAEWHKKGLPTDGVCKKPYLTKIIEQTELDQTRDISIISTDELAKMMHL